MAKEVAVKIKLQAPGGQATPAPPIGPALGQHGVNIGQFVQQFNAQTSSLNGMTVPVEITVFKDKTFKFIVKSPPAAVLLKEAGQVDEGGGSPGSARGAGVRRAGPRDNRGEGLTTGPLEPPKHNSGRRNNAGTQ